MKNCRYGLLIIFAAAVFCGAQAAAEPPVAATPPDLTPEVAKAALLRMIRSPAGQKERLFQGDVPDKVEKLPIQEGKDGWYHWTAAFRIHPATAKYEFTVMPKPGVAACMFHHEGKFEFKDGAWTANEYKLMFTARLTGEFREVPKGE